MATRARAERGGPSVKEQFEGRVRKWVKKWSAVSDKKLAKVQLLKWVQLGKSSWQQHRSKRTEDAIMNNLEATFACRREDRTNFRP
jgi:hypothetical protein